MNSDDLDTWTRKALPAIGIVCSSPVNGCQCLGLVDCSYGSMQVLTVELAALNQSISKPGLESQ